jgi:hypothetical protein
MHVARVPSRRLGADCAPQCARMPTLASRNHLGTRYFSTAAREPSNGPLAISTPCGRHRCARAQNGGRYQV